MIIMNQTEDHNKKYKRQIIFWASLYHHGKDVFFDSNSYKKQSGFSIHGSFQNLAQIYYGSRLDQW